MTMKLVRKMKKEVIIPVSKRAILDTTNPSKKVLIYMNRCARALKISAWLKRHRPEFYLKGSLRKYQEA